jgi:hypothetical protein
MPTYYDYGLGIDDTTQITETGDELASAANYIEPCNVDYAHYTWENQPISEYVIPLIRFCDHPQLSSSTFYITIPSGSPHYIYDSTNTALVSGIAEENNDRDFTLDYTLRGATTGTGDITKETAWSFTTPTLEFGNTEVVASINSDKGIRDTDTVTISRTPTLPPVVTITTETTATTASEITIEGTASDPNSLPFTVSYELSGARTDTGTAVGTDNWTFTEGLSAGDNRFDVTATNSWNLAGSDSLIVTYSPPDDCNYIVDDDFLSPPLGAHWTETYTANGSASVISGQLSMDSGDGDFHLYGTTPSWIYQASIEGDFDIKAKLDSNDVLDSDRDFAGLLVWLNGAQYAFMGISWFSSTDYAWCSVRQEGASSGNIFATTTRPLYLRIARSGSTITTWYSLNGTAWVDLTPGESAWTYTGPVDIGLVANHGASSQFNVKFDWILNVC